MISLRQLRYFDQLARCRHFGRAAAACSVTQPALSMQIRELEAELGRALIERGRDGVKLTKTGEEVASRAVAILAAVADLERRARGGGEELYGAVSLGVIPSVAPYLLPRLLPAIRDRHPQAQLALRETQTEPLMRELLAGSLDAILISLPVDASEVEIQPLFDDAFLLAVPATSPLARRPLASVDLLDDAELLLLEDGHCFREQALTVCRSIDPRRLRSFGATSLSTLMQLVANGQGVTLLPQMFVDAEAREDPRVRLLRFGEPEPKRVLALAYRTTSPIKAGLLALAETIRTACGEAPAAEKSSAAVAGAL
ncbi:hydrogen peroxide-inducible genes activator [Hansschlegelia sp.]|uniref:hydrogen peroxide-inducible genes activator n=1 Tax=Hansschlegelia sp. TaxID=2041892 RepID=UPI002B651A01|nr:LysR substrate-binding domain-containing protein [Hansschlegelia sp.]HVI29138.1 LysR substrate-binding domain-containing protein [Hansschlegelia sp.]